MSIIIVIIYVYYFLLVIFKNYSPFFIAWGVKNVFC